MSYAFYELDDLTDYVKNGSARVLQSLDSQETFEVKYVNGRAVHKIGNMEWSNGKLLLDGKQLSGFSEIKVTSGDNEISFIRHYQDTCMPFIDEGKVEILRCIDGDNATFVRVVNKTRCSYATGALADFTYVQMLPTDFKINHTSSGYGTTTTTTTSPTPYSKGPEKIKPSGNGSSIQRSWTVFLPFLVGLFVPLIIVPSS
uniref:Uncharacterized protein n=1 Tax=Steinernema glaseri TaxID=37863 RepID=A0A1I7Y1G0_9BILA